jgi:REP element-mobilizing transposase RayT
MPQSFASLHIHIVFSTKHRAPLLGDDVSPRLYQYMGGILRQHSCSLIAAGGTSDHVHLLASLSRTITIADALRVIKSSSSGWLHNEFHQLSGFQWQQGYGAFAVSHSNLDQVTAYIAGQKEHHRQRSFQDEYRELLSRHGLGWDERYVWD